jgi:hypothetical protein
MKKIYISPSVEEHTINAIQMLTTSELDKGGDLNDDNIGDVEILSREDNGTNQQNLWNNEW